MQHDPAVPALSASDLSWRYGRRQALDHVTFDVKAGETVMLLGPNGAGKTTLFSLITGLFHPQAGRIALMGQDIQSGPAALAPLGIVFQQPALDLDLTVGQNLHYFCALHGIEKSQAASRIADELARLKMAERLDDKVRSLNGGHRRRVEIARASLHRPRLLLLDEPTVGLDIPTRKELVGDLRARAGADGLSILWATHLIDEIVRADRVIVLHKGRVVADTTPEGMKTMTGTDDLDTAFAVLTREGTRA